MPTSRTFPTGNVIFFHPDGLGLNHWFAGRMYFYGPDGLLQWDQLPHMAPYRGHMNNTL
ncbi:MAG: alkaline phosphatase, partial [Verrucomicrobia bacterium]